jgi:tetratricopeptide (TPR) repeat protein
VNRGDASKELGKVDEALHDYQAALKLASTRPDIIERVVQLISQKAIESFNKRQYEIALSYFGQALELSPNQAQLLTKRGKCYFEMQRYQDALADYNAALVLDP